MIAVMKSSTLKTDAKNSCVGAPSVFRDERVPLGVLALAMQPCQGEKLFIQITC